MSAFFDQSPGIKMAPVFSELNMRYFVSRACWVDQHQSFVCQKIVGQIVQKYSELLMDESNHRSFTKRQNIKKPWYIYRHS